MTTHPDSASTSPAYNFDALEEAIYEVVYSQETRLKIFARAAELSAQNAVPTWAKGAAVLKLLETQDKVTAEDASEVDRIAKELTAQSVERASPAKDGGEQDEVVESLEWLRRWVSKEREFGNLSPVDYAKLTHVLRDLQPLASQMPDSLTGLQQSFLRLAAECRRDDAEECALVFEQCAKSLGEVLSGITHYLSDSQMRPQSAVQGWQPIETAQKRAGPVLLLVKSADHLPARAQGFADIQFVGRYVDAETEWAFAAPVGVAGIPDAWLIGWKHLAAAPQPPQGEGA